MVLDPRAKRLLDMLSLSAATSGPPSIRQRREGFSKLMEIGARPLQIGRLDNLTLPAGHRSIPIRLYDAIEERTQPAPALIFFHGGGLVAGSLDTHDGICGALARSSQAIVISIGYRLAPEHRFPAALEDATFALNWINSHGSSLGVDTSRIAIGGESAGALLVTLITSGYMSTSASFAGQLLLCPVIDLTGNYDSRSQFGKGFLIDLTTIKEDINHCLGRNRPAGSIPTSLQAGIGIRPPSSIIVSAEYDPFRDEASAYTAFAQKAGTAVTLTCYPGMIHSFYGLPAFLPQADGALAQAGKDLAALLS